MNKEIHINFTSAALIKALLIAAMFYLVYFFRDLLLLVLTAVVIASAVEPAVAKMERIKIPRPLGTLFIYIIVILVIAGVLFLVLPAFIRETVNLANAAPQYLTSIELWMNERLAQTGLISSLSSAGPTDIASVSTGLSSIADAFFNGATDTIKFVFGSLFNFMLVIVLSFYFTVQKYGIDNFLKIVVPPSHSDYALNLWHRSQKKIGLWMQGQLVLALVIGAMTFVGLTLLGVKYAFLLSLIAAFGELIPLIGPIISAIPAIGVALSDGGWALASMVLLLFIVIQQLESNVIYPLVVKKVVGVPALVVILGLIVGGTLFGFLGLVLSVPVAAAVMEYVRDIQKRNVKYEKKLAAAAALVEKEK